MKLIEIENWTEKNERLSAVFTPDKGMNMISFKKGSVQVIDQKTKPLFEERAAGLGALIGPHFHHRKPFEINTCFDERIFPHIQGLRKKKILEPFSHGIARYVPWRYDHSSTQIEAKLSSTDLYHNTLISILEGFEFEMRLIVRMLPTGLYFRYDITSEKPSCIGFHTYYHLPKEGGSITSEVSGTYRDQSTLKPLKNDWVQNDQLYFTLPQKADFGFYPMDPIDSNRILYKNRDFSLHLFYECSSCDHSFQIYHPDGAGFVCIEPLSSKNPQKPERCDNRLELKLEIY
ncbi:MAG: hypothetical protein WDZ28_02410 [Simkaniaceae bacterium]